MQITATSRAFFLQGESMIPNRIESFCDLSGFAYLREYQGCLPRGSSKTDRSIISTGGESEPVVVAEEIDGEGKVVRTWFVLPSTHRDGLGLMSQCQFAHTLVSRDIRPGEPSAPYDPNVPVKLGCEIRFDELRLIRAQRDEMLAACERHLIYSQSYVDALKKADGWKSNVENLNRVVARRDATIKERDSEVCDLKNEAALNRLQIATLQASYAALENRKSAKERIKAWFRSKLKRLKEWRLKPVV